MRSWGACLFCEELPSWCRFLHVSQQRATTIAQVHVDAFSHLLLSCVEGICSLWGLLCAVEALDTCTVLLCSVHGVPCKEKVLGIIGTLAVAESIAMDFEFLKHWLRLPSVEQICHISVNGAEEVVVRLQHLWQDKVTV